MDRFDKDLHAHLLSVAILFIGLMACQPASGEYRWQAHELKTEASLRGISVFDQENIWVTGTDGTILKSVDAGSTWQEVTVEGADALDFRDVELLSPDEVVIMSIGEGAQSKVFKTLDGGDSWKLVNQNNYEKGFYDGFVFWDKLEGILGGDPIEGKSYLMKTVDGGNSWQRIAPDLLPLLNDKESGGFAASGSHLAVNGDFVWVASSGGTSRVFISQDRGASWSVVNTPIIQGAASQGIFSLSLYDTQTGIGVGGDHTKETEGYNNVILTHDGGKQWALAKEFPVFQSSVRYIDRSTLVSVGPRGGYISEDGGDSWKPLPGRGYHSLSIGHDGTIWASGQDGGVAQLIREN